MKNCEKKGQRECGRKKKVISSLKFYTTCFPVQCRRFLFIHEWWKTPNFRIGNYFDLSPSSSALPTSKRTSLVQALKRVPIRIQILKIFSYRVLVLIFLRLKLLFSDACCLYLTNTELHWHAHRSVLCSMQRVIVLLLQQLVSWPPFSCADPKYQTRDTTIRYGPSSPHPRPSFGVSVLCMLILSAASRTSSHAVWSFRTCSEVLSVVVVK